MLRAAVLCALVAAGCRTASPPDRLDAFFRGLHARGLFSGAVVVARGGAIVFEGGYGLANVEHGVAFTPDTPADGASLAKTFTAALIADLRLPLDEPARRWLPELPYPSMTLRHLLTHRNGLPGYEWFDRILPRDEVRTTATLLAAVAKHAPPLAFEPGTAFEYSSFGYDLAALAASRAAGKPYGELLRERYFVPLGITSAFLRPARLHDFPGVRTVGYRGTEVHDVFDYEAFHGGSNIYISARDLHRWNASFFDRPAAPAAAPLDLGSWYHSGARYWYSGHLQGFHDEVFRDHATRRSIVYVSNNTLDPWVQHAIVRSVNAILDGRTPETAEPRKTGTPPRPGTYGTISIDGEYAVRDGTRYRMVQLRPNTFYVPGLDLVLGVEKDTLYVSSNVELSAFRHPSRRYGRGDM